MIGRQVVEIEYAYLEHSVVRAYTHVGHNTDGEHFHWDVVTNLMQLVGYHGKYGEGGLHLHTKGGGWGCQLWVRVRDEYVNKLIRLAVRFYVWLLTYYNICTYMYSDTCLYNGHPWTGDVMKRLPANTG